MRRKGRNSTSPPRSKGCCTFQDQMCQVDAWIGSPHPATQPLQESQSSFHSMESARAWWRKGSTQSIWKEEINKRERTSMIPRKFTSSRLLWLQNLLPKGQKISSQEPQGGSAPSCRFNGLPRQWDPKHCTYFNALLPFQANMFLWHGMIAYYSSTLKNPKSQRQWKSIVPWKRWW